MARRRTLVLHARNVPFGWRRLAADTVNARLGLGPQHLRGPLARSARLRFLVDREYEHLSYVMDWREAFERSPELDVRLCDVNDGVALLKAARRIRDYELVVVLHSAAGDHLGRVRLLERALQRRRAPLLVLFGNEYVGMPEKIGFARRVGAELIGSQLPLEAARWLYAECPGRVLPAPPGLEPRRYRGEDRNRDIDVGFRGVLYAHAYALGSLDRETVLEAFRIRGPGMGLAVDIRYERLERGAWATFLNRCRCVPGAESGTAFLERDDRTRHEVIAFLRERPAASFEEVRERWFAGYVRPVSGRAISSRHFEPIGTRTCQVLVAGRYNDILRPGEHYIAVRPDLADLEEAVRALRDESCRREIADRALAHVLTAHTYDHRVASLVRSVAQWA